MRSSRHSVLVGSYTETLHGYTNRFLIINTKSPEKENKSLSNILFSTDLFIILFTSARICLNLKKKRKNCIKEHLLIQSGNSKNVGKLSNPNSSDCFLLNVSCLHLSLWPLQ